jgi:chromosome segregation ATPase
LRAIASDEEQGLRETIQQFSADMKYLQDLTKQIDEYSGSNKPQELDQVASKAKKIVERIEQKKKTVSSLQPEVEQRHKNQLEKNVDILQAEERIHVLRKEIGDLETKLKNVDGQETCYERQTEARKRQAQLLSSKARTEGRWGEIVEQIRSLKVS